MSVAASLPGRMTVDEFLAWHPEDGRTWQLVDGEPQAMAPASETHALLQAEIARLVGNHLVGTACAVAIAPGVRPRLRANLNFRIPGLAVTCSPRRPDATSTESPILMVEILSSGDERETWANMWTYTTIPSVQEILCVRLAFVTVELLRRHADGTWPEEPERIERGALHLASIDFTCDVAALCRTTHLSVGTPPPR